MNTYITLSGQRIDIGAIRADMARLPAALWSAYEEEETKAPPDPFAYAERARNLIGVTAAFVTPTQAREILTSPVGILYRDCFYRLLLRRHLDESGARLDTPEGENSRKSLIRSLAHNPARLILDRFLDGWPTRGAFAEAADLEPSTVSRLFAFVLDPGRVDPGVSLGRLFKTAEKLGIFPEDVGAHDDGVEDVSDTPFALEQIDSTLRDRHLRGYLSLVARIWWTRKTSPNIKEQSTKRREAVCKSILDHTVAIAYGVTEDDRRKRLVDILFNDVTERAKVAYYGPADALDGALGQRFDDAPLLLLSAALKEDLRSGIEVDVVDQEKLPEENSYASFYDALPAVRTLARTKLQQRPSFDPDEELPLDVRDPSRSVVEQLIDSQDEF